MDEDCPLAPWSFQRQIPFLFWLFETVSAFISLISYFKIWKECYFLLFEGKFSSWCLGGQKMEWYQVPAA